MVQRNAAQLFKAVQQDSELAERLKATNNPEAFIKIATERGYNFTVGELENELNKLSSEELASIVNPGIAPRLHILPR